MMILNASSDLVRFVLDSEREKRNHATQNRRARVESGEGDDETTVCMDESTILRLCLIERGSSK